MLPIVLPAKLFTAASFWSRQLVELEAKLPGPPRCREGGDTLVQSVTWNTRSPWDRRLAGWWLAGSWLQPPWRLDKTSA